MSRFRRLAVLARAWLRPGTVDREFHEELRFHVEREAEANREAGLSPEDALRAGVRAFDLRVYAVVAVTLAAAVVLAALTPALSATRRLTLANLQAE
jgi:hypothetical protein